MVRRLMRKLNTNLNLLARVFVVPAVCFGKETDYSLRVAWQATKGEGKWRGPSGRRKKRDQQQQSINFQISLSDKIRLSVYLVEYM